MEFLAGLLIFTSLGYSPAPNISANAGSELKARVAPDSGRHFDAYGSISFKQEKIRLNYFARALKSEPNVQGYIFVYAGAASRMKIARERARRSIDYVVNEQGVDPKRIVAAALVRGLHPTFAVDLWIYPQGGPDDLAKALADGSQPVFVVTGTEISKRKNAPDANLGSRQDGLGTGDVMAFDSYANISLEEERKRLDAFAEVFRKDREARGHIVVYALRRSHLRLARLRARRILNYVVNSRGSDPERIVAFALDASDVNELKVVLWAFPDEGAAAAYLQGMKSDLGSRKLFTINGTEVSKQKRDR